MNGSIVTAALKRVCPHGIRFSLAFWMVFGLFLGGSVFGAENTNPKIAKITLDGTSGIIDENSEYVNISLTAVATVTSGSGTTSITAASWSTSPAVGDISGAETATMTVTRDDLEKLNGVKSGTDTIYTVTATVSNISLSNDFSASNGTAQATVTITTKCPCNSGNNNSVDFDVPIHAGEFGGSAQSLILRLQKLNDPLDYQRSRLQWNKSAGVGLARSETITEGLALRQLLHGGYLADVNDIPDGYSVKLYSPQSVGGKSAISGLYTFRGEPYSEYTFVNPDPGAVGRFLITNIDRSSGNPVTHSWLYSNSRTEATETWILTRYKEGKVASRDSLERTEITGGAFPMHSQIRTIEEAGSDDGVLYTTSKTKETYVLLKAGEKTLIEEVEGFGEAGARTNTFDYYMDPGDPVTFRLPKATRYWNGKWSQFTYEAGSGTTVTREVTGFENAPFGDVANSRVITTTNATIQDAAASSTIERREETVKGVLVSRVQTTIKSNPLARVPISVGSFPEDVGFTTTTIERWLPDNKRSIEKVIKNTRIEGPGRFRLKFKQNINGTVERYSYASDTGNPAAWTETVERGAGNEIQVTDGTRTVSHFNEHGVMDYEGVYDIVTGARITEKQAVAQKIDTKGRVLMWFYEGDLNDTSEVSYGCCGVEWEKARDGTETVYTYDDSKRIVTKVITLGNRVDMVRTVYVGLTQRQYKQIDGDLKLVSENSTDLSGNVTTSKAVAGNATNFELVPTTSVTEVINGGGHRVTTTHPDGSIGIEDTLADGQVLRKVERKGWATQLETVYTRGVHSVRGGGLWEEQRQNGVRWVKSIVGLNGIQIRREQPTFENAGVVVTVNDIDTAGRIVKVTPPVGPPTLTHYNTKGEIDEVVIDVDGNGVVSAPDKVDRTVTQSVRTVTLGSQVFGEGVLVTRSVLNDAGNEIVRVRNWRSFDGLASASESLGLVTSMQKTRPRNGAWVSDTLSSDSSYTHEVFTDGVPIHRFRYASGSDIPISHSVTGYDSRWRRLTETERRHLIDGVVDVATTYGYFDSDQIASVQTAYDAANGSVGTIYNRDVLGREISVQLPDGSTRETVYTDAEGIVRTSGSQVYPNEVRKDSFGQQVELKTWQDFAGNNGLASTQWIFDPTTGLLKAKQYPDGKQVQYKYDATGRLSERKWARGLKATYTYAALGGIESVTYSDDTPSVVYGYNRNGQMLTAGSYSYIYDPNSLQLLSETVSVAGGVRVIERKRDELQRDAGFRLLNGTDIDLETTWTYDANGRPGTISALDRTFTYNYVDGRPELLDNVQGPVVTAVNTWEPLRNVLKSKANKRSVFSDNTASSFTYTVNALGQRTAVRTTGDAFGGSVADWDWRYNEKGEVTSASQLSDVTKNRAFLYDDIGNRAWATTGNPAPVAGSPLSVPSGGDVTRYSANSLNQYSEVNSGAVVSPVHDDDGNLVDDGTLLYTWDGENRLKSVSRKSDQALVGVYTYDHKSRRTSKRTFGNSPVTIGFVYDGWNPIAEYQIAGSGSAVLNVQNVWGLDLSGSEQGAGGVGGLLIRAQSGGRLNYAYDANGNVTECFGDSGAVVAHYEYGPFGESLVATGVTASSNPFRFSSKYQDAETSLLYYGYRYYNAVTGRWPSRDPIEEEGGINLYGMVGNNGVDRVDQFGLKSCHTDRLDYEIGVDSETFKPVSLKASVRGEFRVCNDCTATLTAKVTGAAEAEFPTAANWGPLGGIYVVGSFEISGELTAKWKGRILDTGASGGSLSLAAWIGGKAGNKAANVRVEAGVSTSWKVSAYSTTGSAGLHFNGNEVNFNARARATVKFGSRLQYNSEIYRYSMKIGTAPNFDMAVPSPGYN